MLFRSDSVTVAPAMTLDDREQQLLRDAAIQVVRAVGVETGGANVQFALNRQTGEKLDLNATGGLYDSKARLLDLQGGVRMQSEGRFSAEMDRARVDVAAKTIRSEVPVTVTLPSGVIAANGMEITDDGKRILFFNRVKVTLRGSGASKGTTAP